MLPNLAYCQRCNRFEKHEESGAVYCHNEKTDDQEIKGHFSHIGQLIAHEGQQVRIAYNMQFSVPYDCPCELEHMGDPPALERRQKP